ncbi:MAG: hypothetical protein SF187_14760 [Deltaproteobacteria bacterium]|nr:hypothetical protein [Deltaproteobacteria bacterium]
MMVIVRAFRSSDTWVEFDPNMGHFRTLAKVQVDRVWEGQGLVRGNRGLAWYWQGDSPFFTANARTWNLDDPSLRYMYVKLGCVELLKIRNSVHSGVYWNRILRWPWRFDPTFDGIDADADSFLGTPARIVRNRRKLRK